MAYKDKEKLYQYNNKWAEENRDRFSLLLPAGMKEEIKKRAEANGESLNGYINRLIRQDMER